MCGIWASVGFEAPTAAIEVVAHRGPNGQAVLRRDSAQGPVWLKHRRLSIYDLDDRSAQPMVSANGNEAIVFNGAIYNFRDLRVELAAAGDVFRTDGDTEVLLAAIKRWGPAALDRFNGMFAFVIHDAQRGRLFAARDRFGVKPLNLWAGHTPSGRTGIAFASELKQLLTIPGVVARADQDVLHDFLHFGITDHSARTAFTGLAAVPAGHLVEIDLARGLPTTHDAVPTRRWYDLPPAASTPIDAEDAVGLVRRSMRNAVRLRLAADVPVGSCLSGGIDSSAIVGTIADIRRGNEGSAAQQHCVSAVFPGASVDESRYVDAVAARWPGIHVHRVEPDHERLVHELDRLIWHQDEPFGSTSIFAQWSVFGAARRAGLTVMLDGQGADELFGGYLPMHGAHLGDLVRAGRLVAAARSATSVMSGAGPSIKRQALWTAADLLPQRLTTLGRRFAGQLPMARWLKEPAADFRVAPRHDDVGRGGGMDALSRRLLQATSLPMLLRFEDRNSMAFGIEARVPFLDVHVVEAAMTIGGRYNIIDGETKWIERRAFADVLPREVLARRDKIGFAAPEAQWFRGALKAQARQGLKDAVDMLGSRVDAARLLKDCNAMLDGTRAYDTALWRLWCLAAWARTFRVAI